MPAFKDSDLIYFLAFVVPGFLSMQIYSQIRPRQRSSLKDSLLEAVAFGSINFVLLIWAILWVIDPQNYENHPELVYVGVVSIFLVMPAIWPVLLVILQNFLSRFNIFLASAPTAWDHFFHARKPCWVIVHLDKERRIGGRFGRKSYASSYPDPGHIYIEELWSLDKDGGFVQKIGQSRGIVLRPSDYHLIEFFDD